MRTGAQARANVAIGLGLVLTLVALLLLITIDPSEPGTWGTVRELAGYAVAAGLLVTAGGAIDRVPTPQPTAAQLDAAASSRRSPNRRWAWIVACGLLYCALAWLARNESLFWLLLLGGVAFLIHGGVLYLREGRKGRSAD